jgi:hypothetical protein
MSGELVEGERIYLKPLRLAKETRSTSLMLDALVGLALYHVRSGKNGQAWELSDIILNLVATVQETKDRLAMPVNMQPIYAAPTGVFIFCSMVLYSPLQ